MANGHLYPQAEKAGNSYFQHNHLWHNLRDGRFELLPESQSGFTRHGPGSRGAAFGDLANSGRVWVVVNNIDQVPFLYEPSGTAGNWVRIRLTGTRSNRSAIGARVRVTTGELTQTNEVRSGDSYLVTAHSASLRLGSGKVH